MNKLIELLNEYKKPGKYKEYWYNGKQVKLIEYAKDYAESTSEDITEKIISKKFGFIQWLVKHFMLNMTKIDARISLSDFNATDRMLMALAISDNPIELLIDCLE